MDMGVSSQHGMNGMNHCEDNWWQCWQIQGKPWWPGVTSGQKNIIFVSSCHSNTIIMGNIFHMLAFSSAVKFFSSKRIKNYFKY